MTLTLLMDLPMDFQPGEEWSYNNSGYVLLGYIIEQVAGQTYEEFLQQFIFDPLGMQDSGYDHNRDDIAIGYANMFREADYIDMTTPFSAGALYSSVEDLYRWDQALYTERLISDQYLAEMFAEQAYIGAGDGSASEVNYGYGWFIADHLDHKYIGHGGEIEGYVTVIARYPDDNVTIIMLSNQQDANVGFIAELLLKKVLAIE
jgi:CubicO group peptidase (beta-lactamase class C family)